DLLHGHGGSLTDREDSKSPHRPVQAVRREAKCQRTAHLSFRSRKMDARVARGFATFWLNDRTLRAFSGAHERAISATMNQTPTSPDNLPQLFIIIGVVCRHKVKSPTSLWRISITQSPEAENRRSTLQAPSKPQLLRLSHTTIPNHMLELWMVQTPNDSLAQGLNLDFGSQLTIHSKHQVCLLSSSFTIYEHY
ncbi:hypothetical protein PCASD_25260, partial [Puccinia coronata f. sp. avenae]